MWLKTTNKTRRMLSVWPGRLLVEWVVRTENDDLLVESRQGCGYRERRRTNPVLLSGVRIKWGEKVLVTSWRHVKRVLRRAFQSVPLPFCFVTCWHYAESWDLCTQYCRQRETAESTFHSSDPADDNISVIVGLPFLVLWNLTHISLLFTFHLQR